MTTVSDKIGTMNPSSQPFTVLAVDDSAISRKLVEHSLLGQEYEVLFAKNGREALDLFAEHEPAVVITDWSMPDIGGLELCRRIRRDFQGFHSHLILLASNSNKEQAVEGLVAGADDYLTKPFHSGELVARIAVGHRIVEPGCAGSNIGNSNPTTAPTIDSHTLQCN